MTVEAAVKIKVKIGLAKEWLIKEERHKAIEA